ncbi:hypothetical protein B0H17DRAFT_902779, partial [Mycena rosella]
DQQARLRGMNRCLYYQWILQLVAGNSLRIVYTPGHSSDISIPARMNYEADHYASSAQCHIDDVFSASIPTFLMDEFTFHTAADGWIESNIRNYVNKSQILGASNRTAAGHQQRMSTYLCDAKAPHEYTYMTAYSAYSAIVQLYAHSEQLATADVLHSRGKLIDPQCRMGCDATEDQHHIFVHCECYASWRTKAAKEICRCTNNKLEEKAIEEVDCGRLLATAKSLFSDDEYIWPLHY